MWASGFLLLLLLLDFLCSNRFQDLLSLECLILPTLMRRAEVEVVSEWPLTASRLMEECSGASSSSMLNGNQWQNSGRTGRTAIR